MKDLSHVSIGREKPLPAPSCPLNDGMIDSLPLYSELNAKSTMWHVTGYAVSVTIH